MRGSQRPLELILARNFMASLSTPGFLVDEEGQIAFYNDAAGILIGRRYEDTGAIPATEWTRAFGPFDDDGVPIDFERLDLTNALRGNRPAHDRFCISVADGRRRQVEVSALPIVGGGGFRGALVVFWPADEGGGA